MSNFFIKIYDYFSKHRPAMWSLLVILVGVMALGATQIRYEEDITNFFPEQEQDVSTILKNLKVGNRFALFVTTTKEGDEDALIDCADVLASEFESNFEFYTNATLTKRIDDSLTDSVTNFIYDNLPFLLDNRDFEQLESLASPKAIELVMQQNYTRLTSVIGGYISDYIYRDPLSIGTGKLKGLEVMGSGFSYNMIDGYILSTDSKTLMIYIDPVDGGDLPLLVEIVESTLKEFNARYDELTIDYFGAPAVAYYNAKQIKLDSIVTLNIAILIVVIFILFSFRGRRNVVLLLVPVLFGVLFALSLIYLIQGGISLIAIGSGSIIFGLAFSYSIHLISHADHCDDIYTVIKELVYPLTIGSITTIGAFVGLMFTNSKLLQDFGLFSSLLLIGTTIFTLVFLPQFIRVTSEKKKANKLLCWIDKIADRSYENNKILVWSILVFASLSAIFFNDVKFDSNMMNLNYDPPHLKVAEDRLNNFSKRNSGESNVIFLATAQRSSDAISAYKKLALTLDSLRSSGNILSFSDVNTYILNDSIQQLRLDRWNDFWANGRREEVISAIVSSEKELGFNQGVFSEFTESLSRDYKKIEYGSDSKFAQLFPEWITANDSITILMSQVRIDDSKKDSVYSQFIDNKHIIAADKAYFASLMAKDISENFYLVLYISGLLIFSVLLLSYGRIELAIISFMPMFIGWLIIIGLMSLFGIQFNIVTIILSTFIFGIGDDFSIFVMDGLQGNYRDNSGVLSFHKRAIFISALSLIVGMGALIFAKHPAMYSLGLVSLIGMVVVVVVSYIIPPLMFRSLITKHTSQGNFPFTFVGVLNTIYAFGLFVTGCFSIQLIMVISYLFIFKKSRRQLFIHRLTSWFTRSFLRVMVTTKLININPLDEKFDKPAVIIANHQSFVDILLLLGLNNKFVMVTNSWVWNSPFFGPIVRFLDFFHTADGYENSIDALSKKVAEGYSIVVFPEGTRSVDNDIKRFHKGAFYIAERLKLDIIPVLIYGTGLVSSKSQPIYIKHGIILSTILPRISFESTQYGVGYRERSKCVRKYFKKEYNNLYEELNRASNPYYRDLIIKNYIYKGPVLEWYMRVKLRLERWYDQYDRLLPREGYIVDLGCGYGAMSYMLAVLSRKRRITAIDYDTEKITVAKNCFLKRESVEFISGDIRYYDIPAADGYVISDVLHYVDQQAQQTIIERCIARLNNGGVLIIKDGDTSQSKGHRNTETTELWSTQYMKFNKIDGPLCFLSREMIFKIAEDNNMNIEIVESGKRTSNTIFLITHK